MPFLRCFICHTDWSLLPNWLAIETESVHLGRDEFAVDDYIHIQISFISIYANVVTLTLTLMHVCLLFFHSFIRITM